MLSDALLSEKRIGMKTQRAGEQGYEISLLDVWGVFVRRWRLVVGFALVVTLIAGVNTFLKPKMYLSTAKILPATAEMNTASKLGAMASMFGMSQSSSEKTKLFALLSSQTLAYDVVETLDLITESTKVAERGTAQYDRLLDDAARKMNGMVTISDEVQTGALRIAVKTSDPELSQRIATGYIKGLRRRVNDTSLTQAKRKRIFIYEQIVANSQKLLGAEKKLNVFYEQHHVSAREPTIDVSLGDGFDFLTSRTTEESQRHLDISSAVESIENPASFGSSPVVQTVRNVPHKAYLHYLTFQRNILTEMQALLSRQYEVAKIEEAEHQLAFHVLDKPSRPYSWHTPNRRLDIIFGALVGVFGGIFIIFFLEYIDYLRRQRLVEETVVALEKQR
jgi:uncharacterized protein involved in exopolysaccharide biosynthesis